jgi:hypothetical protein
VPPPDQCFGTTDQKRLGIDDWLIVQFKLVQLNRATQLILKGVARARRHAHFWIKEAIPISSGRLCTIEGQIRHFHETVGIGCMLRRESNADACCNVDLVAFDIKRPGDDFDNAVGKSTRVATLIIFPVLDNGELVAAQSRQNVCFSKRRLESRCNFPQERIANGMTQGVIDVLEPVEIQQQHGELVAAPAM